METRIAAADVCLGIAKYYGSTAVVRDRSQRSPGQLVALLGPTGCGKTTTLRMIAGLIEPEAGEIPIRGQSVSGVPVHERDVGVLFQDYALFPHLSVLDNVAFGLDMRPATAPAIAPWSTRRWSWCDWPISASATRINSPAASSSAWRWPARWLSSPRCCCSTSRSARSTRSCAEEMQIELKDNQARLELTTIMVTHDQEEALTISDRIAVMNAGRIEQMARRRTSTIVPPPASWRSSSAPPMSLRAK